MNSITQTHQLTTPPIQTTASVPVLLTQYQLAEWLGKSAKWAEAARFYGTGPKFIKVGRAVRYRTTDVLQWLEDQTRTSTADRGGVL